MHGKTVMMMTIIIIMIIIINMGKKVNITERRTGSNTSTNKIQTWNGAQYVKKRCRSTKNNAKLESPWKRLNSKFLAYATYSNTQAYSCIFKTN